MKKLWKRGLGLALAGLLLLSGAARAEGEPQEEQDYSIQLISAAVQTPSPWAYEYIADAYALKLVDDGLTSYITSPVTPEQVESMAAVVADKLAQLELAPNEAESEELVIDTTRGGVVNALYQELAAYDLPEAPLGAVEALRTLKVLRGDDTGLALERECTYQEAMVMTTRLILAVYDGQDAGAHGLLWKAVNGDNTLYLLGTAHMDRGNLYPFHKELRDAITSSETVILELDLNDQEGIAEFMAMQTYPEGDGLENHVSEEVYQSTVALFAQLGLPEEQTRTYKPWALANTLTSMMASDTESGAPMAIDLYVNAAAANRGIPVAGAETYALQGGVFESLSPEYQEMYLASYVAMLTGAGDGEEADPEAQAALELQNQQLDAMMNAWITGDVDGMAALLNKAAVLESDDELNAKLFTDRDPGMIQVAASYLEQDDGAGHTYFMAVGAGHMLDPGGIVSGLQELGFTVEPVWG